MTIEDIRGTSEQLFQLGIEGPNLKNNSDVLEIRNSDDSNFSRLKILDPIDDNDAATKIYLQSKSLYPLQWKFMGNLQTQIERDGFRVVPKDSSIDAVYLGLGAQGWNSSIEVDIKGVRPNIPNVGDEVEGLSYTSIYNTTPKPIITGTSNFSNRNNNKFKRVALPDIVDLVSNDFLTVDIDVTSSFFGFPQDLVICLILKAK